MVELTGLVAVAAPFITAICIMFFILCGPKARAKAEILKAQAMAEIEQQKMRTIGANNEKMALVMVEQDKRMEALEEELSFLRKLMDQR